MTPGPFAQLKQHLEIERSFGIESIAARPLAERPDVTGDRKAALDALNGEFKDCRLCGLCETRTRLVFGSGNPNAELMFVGEAPGFDEDKQGLPFVGKAGQLLTRIIEAMTLGRESVYIANCLKCRPPENRSPLPAEIITCKPILDRQIAIIRPRVICALGKFAAQTLLNTEEPISRLRGRFVERDGFKIMPTFHPAYLLRNPDDKKLVWEDMKKVMAELGIALPAPKR